MTLTPVAVRDPPPVSTKPPDPLPVVRIAVPPLTVTLLPTVETTASALASVVVTEPPERVALPPLLAPTPTP